MTVSKLVGFCLKGSEYKSGLFFAAAALPPEAPDLPPSGKGFS